MTSRGKELALETMLMQGIGLAGAGILLAPILVTYDTQKQRIRLFNFGPDGSMTEHDRFTVSGSGARARLLLGERWKPSLSVAEGAALIRQLILEIPDRVDSFSGGTPSIDLVGPDGISTVEE
jgi:20S proteasome alpha/beta subunit